MKKLLSILTSGAIMFSSVGFSEFPVQAVKTMLSASAAGIIKSGTCGENLTWTLDSEGTLTISGTGKMIDIDSSEPFMMPWYSNIDRIKNVVIQNGVTNIGKNAFNICINLKSVTIPDSVTSIGDIAFYDCSSLESINIPDSVINIGDYAFMGCTSLKSITIPDSVTSIGRGAFLECTSLESINIPDSVTSIGDVAFYRCKSIESINVNESNKYYLSENGVLFNKDKNTIMCFPAAKATNTYNIPDSVTNICKGAFNNCKSLESITIPDSVTSIGESVFSGCTSLKSITIPDSITSIGDEAFRSCASLKSITIPDSVTSIGDEAFFCCTSLESINIPDSVIGIGYRAFYSCKSLKSITIPASVTSIGRFENCESLESINVDENNKFYSSEDGVLFNKNKNTIYCFPVAKTTNTYNIPDSVTSIGNYAFNNCTNLESIIIPDSIISIGDYAFMGCTSLKSITIPDSVTNIGALAFHSCTTLKSITIPDSVISICSMTFYDCTSLESITIPDSVTSIGERAFAGSSLESITIPDSVTSIGELAFSHCTSLKAITIPDSVISIGELAFYSCTSLKSITIPASVTSIGKNVFSGCTSLESITIPDSVISIGDEAFYSCTSLKSITIPASVTSIGKNVFSGCTSLESISILNPKCEINNLSSDAIIKGYKGSTAEEYAKKYNRTFVALDDETPVTTTSTTAIVTTTKRTTTTTTKATTTTTVTTTLPPETTPKFKDGINNWSFYNSSRNFGSTYYINDTYMNALLKGMSRTEQEELKKILSEPWVGSCYGMASTSILSCYDILEPSKYQSGANFLHDITAPPTAEEKSLINYYFALQVTDEIYQKTTNARYQSEETKIKKLLSQLEDDSPTLLTFFLGSGGGHAVVAYDVEYGSFAKNRKGYNAKVITYDNNAIDFNDDYCMYINTSDYSWYIPHYKADTRTGSTLGFTSDDLSVINYHGYLSGNTKTSFEDYISVLSSKAIASDFSLRKISMNTNGSYNINAGSEDDIKAFSSFTDDFSESDMKFAISGSNKGCIMELNKNESIDMSMRYQNDFMTVDFASANKIIFDPSGYIEVSGENSKYSFNMVSNDGFSPTDWYDMSVSGTGAEVTFKKSGNGYILKSDSLSNITLKAESDNAEPSCKFSTDKKEVYIYEIDENTIGVSIDSDGNGTFETAVKTADANNIVYGDANCDGKTSVADAVAILQYIGNRDKYKLTESGLKNADVDGISGVTGKDALVIQQVDAGLYKLEDLPLKTK